MRLEGFLEVLKLEGSGGERIDVIIRLQERSFCSQSIKPSTVRLSQILNPAIVALASMWLSEVRFPS